VLSQIVVVGIDELYVVGIGIPATVVREFHMHPASANVNQIYYADVSDLRVAITIMLTPSYLITDSEFHVIPLNSDNSRCQGAATAATGFL
jgi:hypothetical protein